MTQDENVCKTKKSRGCVCSNPVWSGVARRGGAGCTSQNRRRVKIVVFS